MTRSVAVLLPKEPMDQEGFTPSRLALIEKFGPLENLDFFCSRDTFSHYANHISGKSISPITDASSMKSYDVVALCVTNIAATDPGYGIQFEYAPHARRYHVATGDGGLVLVNVAGKTTYLDEEEYPFLNTHVFNRLSAQEKGIYEALRGYIFFPYGTLYRHVGMGPINEFGHRIIHDLHALESRSSNVKVIAVFGGSAAFSMFCRHQQMFPTLIENGLNEKLAKAKSKKRVVVVNFGQNGDLVLNQTITYNLFCHKLQPDFVIAHDGVNDLTCGQVVDPYLVQNWNIAYANWLEEWSQILHDSQERPLTQPWKDPAVKLRTLTAAPLVVKSYLERKQQFMQIVQANGGKFIWALQPISFSKGALAPKEVPGVTWWTEQSLYSAALRRLGSLFDMSSQAAVPEGALTVDLHKLFKKFGSEDALFWDHCHLFPIGDQKIAEFYIESLLPHIE